MKYVCFMLIFFLFVGCTANGSQSAAPNCAPGEVVLCPCGNNLPDGAQQCSTDGVRFGNCDCGTVSNDTSSSSHSNATTAPNTDVNSDSDAIMNAESDVISGSDTGSGTWVASAGTGTDTDTDSDVISGSDTGSGTGQEDTSSNTAADMGRDTGVDTEIDTDSGTDSKTVSGSDSGSGTWATDVDTGTTEVDTGTTEVDTGTTEVDTGTTDPDIDTDTDTWNDSSVVHVFLLLGQSNMSGFTLADDADKAIDERIQMLGYDGTCGRAANVWAPAKPALHDFNSNAAICAEKVSPGDWFAKTIIKELPNGHAIGLVPAAFGGMKIEDAMLGGKHYNTIVEKINIAKATANVRFEGILLHQGESDAEDILWPGNVKTLYDQLKTAMGINYDIPFLVGEMLYEGGAADHNSIVNLVPEQGGNFHVVSAEGLVRAVDDPWNLHFSHDSTVELGIRYADKMTEALGW